MGVGAARWQCWALPFVPGVEQVSDGERERGCGGRGGDVGGGGGRAAWYPLSCQPCEQRGIACDASDKLTKIACDTMGCSCWLAYCQDLGFLFKVDFLDTASAGLLPGWEGKDHTRIICRLSAWIYSLKTEISQLNEPGLVRIGCMDCEVYVSKCLWRCMNWGILLILMPIGAKKKPFSCWGVVWWGVPTLTLLKYRSHHRFFLNKTLL